jgi:hypothetical protein
MIIFSQVSLHSQKLKCLKFSMEERGEAKVESLCQDYQIKKMAESLFARKPQLFKCLVSMCLVKASDP